MGTRAKQALSLFYFFYFLMLLAGNDVEAENQCGAALCSAVYVFLCPLISSCSCFECMTFVYVACGCALLAPIQTVCRHLKEKKKNKTKKTDQCVPVYLCCVQLCI